jgi:hypothetical protein
MAQYFIVISRHIPINPVRFQRGDIVEVQMSISAVVVSDKMAPNQKQKKYKLLLNLHSITLLDPQFTTV